MSMALYVLPYLALSPIYRLTLPTVQGKRVGVLDFERILDIPPRWTFRYCYLLAHSQLSASLPRTVEGNPGSTDLVSPQGAILSFVIRTRDYVNTFA